jgi:methionine synthase II (cobalamin-independent)
MKEISQRTRDDFMYFDECRAKALMPTIEEVKISREKEIEVMYKKVEKILDQQYNITIDPLTTGQTNRSNIYMQYFQKNEDRF